MNYKIELVLSEENLVVLTESLTAYKGNKRLIADCILAIIKRQTEIQIEEFNKER